MKVRSHGQHLTISLLLGAPVLAASLTDTSWVGTGRVRASTRVRSCAHWLARSLAFVFLLTPLPPRQRNFSVVTAPVAGGNASSFRSLLLAHRHRLEDHSYCKQTGTSHTPVWTSCSGHLLWVCCQGRSPCTGPPLSLSFGHLSGPWGCLLQPAW